MNFHIVSIFPDVFKPYINESLLKRAQKNKLIKFSFYNPRDYTKDKHKKVDDKPFGGGPGMVMRAEPLVKAALKAKGKKQKVKTIILSPRGKVFSTTEAEKLKKYNDIIFICGRYEGIDARVKKILKADEYSIGPYTLTGGELPAMVMIDAVARRIPGVLGSAESIEERRIAGKDVYTRPREIIYKGKKYKVPKVLISGNHKNIEGFRGG